MPSYDLTKKEWKRDNTKKPPRVKETFDADKASNSLMNYLSGRHQRRVPISGNAVMRIAGRSLTKEFHW